MLVHKLSRYFLISCDRRTASRIGRLVSGYIYDEFSFFINFGNSFSICFCHRPIGRNMYWIHQPNIKWNIVQLWSNMLDQRHGTNPLHDIPRTSIKSDGFCLYLLSYITLYYVSEVNFQYKSMILQLVVDTGLSTYGLFVFK